MLLTLERAWELRRQGTRVRVLVDGHDVTRWCLSADDAQGWALLLAGGLNWPRARVRLHQGQQVVEAMPVLGRVQFVYELDDARRVVVLEVEAGTGKVLRHTAESH